MKTSLHTAFHLKKTRLNSLQLFACIKLTVLSRHLNLCTLWKCLVLENDIWSFSNLEKPVPVMLTPSNYHVFINLTEVLYTSTPVHEHASVSSIQMKR